MFISLLVEPRQGADPVPPNSTRSGEEVTDIYLAKMGAMVTATVRGQFVIAVCQGVAGAISIYIAGFHDGFFMFVIFLTALSFIPLGSGIVTIPFGHRNVLFGNVFGGVFVVVFHLHRGDEHRQLCCARSWCPRGAPRIRR